MPNDSDVARETLSDITVHMKYSRYIPAKQRRETWEEIVDRNKEMHIRRFPGLKDEINEAYKLVYDKKVLPSMRSMQFAGKPIEINNSRVYNCAYMPVEHTDAFSETMFLLLGGTGVGYALDLNTPIPIPTGWKKMEELEVGDEVFGDDGKVTKIINVSPIYNNHKVYEIEFSNGQKIKSDENHLWTIQTRGQRNASGNRTGLNTMDKKTKELKTSDSIKVSNPMELPEKNLILDPYILGYWLGDGTTKQPVISTGDEFIVEEFDKLGFGLTFLRRYDYYVKNGLGKKLRELGLQERYTDHITKKRIEKGIKKIPQEYLRASKKQRLSLLQGLMDSDGTCTKKGQCVFSVKLENLARETLELCSSLGLNPTLKSRMMGKLKMWVVSFTTEMSVFRLPRKLKRLQGHTTQSDRIFIKNIKEVNSIPVKCITVDNESHLYLAGRLFVPTHNSVQKHHVEKLPVIKGIIKPRGRERKKRYLVGDSIEGWSDAIKVLVESWFYGKREIEFDYRDIRQKGARLITSGGKAPGPAPLRECVVQITNIFENVFAERGYATKLEPVEIHDIFCHIADAVLAGGIRRAAMISLFSMNDETMATCKLGDWWEKNPQRGRANNSAVIVRNKVKKKDFTELWKKVEASGSGEPGIYFTNDKDWGINPCAEIALRPYGFCVAGDTNLITKQGIENIENTTDKEIEIWNGESWKKVSPYKTGNSDILYRVQFSDGSYLDATNNHKFLTKNRFEESFVESTTLEIIDKLKTSKYPIQIPHSNIIYKDGINEVNAYDFGFVLGDGSVYQNLVYGALYNDDKLLEFNTAENQGKELTNIYGTKYQKVKFKLDVDFCKVLKYNDKLPKKIFTWNKSSILNFIAGWADADGSQASKGIRIYDREDKIRNAQLLLTKIGIYSSVNLMSKKGSWTNLGERKNDIWYLQITKTIEIPCQRLICDNKDEALFKGKYQIIKSIEELEGTHNSYCLTENEKHQCVFNNVLTKQCNLTEINASNITSQEDFNNRAKVASFIGTLQASYTDFHYLRDEWRKTAEKDALLGVSMTGIASGAIFDLNSEEAANVAIKENERIAEIIEINKAARVTTVKPSGTTSLVLGTSSGIHAWHNDYYIRRIRVGKNEAIYKYLSIHHPELLEDEYFKPDSTAVISIPQKAPSNAILRVESPIETLERVKRISQEWIAPGHINGMNSHNVSCTINLKDDEWEDVGRWMWDNRKFYNGIAVFPYYGGTFPQAPFEDCDEKTYNKILKSLKEIDLTKIIESDDDTNLAGEIACGGSGSCDITESHAASVIAAMAV